jgi:integrase/recombinase XerD
MKRKEACAMKVSKAIQYALEYHRNNSRKNTVRSCEMVFARFESRLKDRELASITPDEVLSFLTQLTEGRKQSTKRSRYAALSAFFSLIQNTLDPQIQNPCKTTMLKKLFRPAKAANRQILEKETVDEIIFRTPKPRNRIILELMARGGMRIGEVLGLRVRDVDGCKLILKAPKSGKEAEVVFIPQKVANRLREYIEDRKMEADQRIFPLTYQGARAMVKKAGNLVGIRMAPHDLRRHAATYASRSGTPIEIVSKIILRHANLSTTQRYLGKVSDVEALRWIENLHG